VVHNPSTPHYASRKYRNTVFLLGRAKSLKKQLESGEIPEIGAFELRKFKLSVGLLQMKEQVLGYLEDMTQGSISSSPITQSQLRLYSDLLLSDKTPDWPENTSSLAKEKAAFLRGCVYSSSEPEKVKQTILRNIYLESQPDINIDKVENLVLAGGGAKALSLAGALKAIDDSGRNQQISRVAGTSGGAIISLAYAAGYSSVEMSDLVLDNSFGLFTLGSRLDNRIMNQWAGRFSSTDKKEFLHVLSDNSMAHSYHDHIIRGMAHTISESDNPDFSVLKKHLSKGATPKEKETIMVKALSSVDEDNRDVSFEKVMDLLGMKEIIKIDAHAIRQVDPANNTYIEGPAKLYKSPKLAMLNAMRHISGQDVIKLFFGDLIVDKLKHLKPETLRVAFYGESKREDENAVVSPLMLRKINFEQWQSIHSQEPDKVKELHISICIKKPFLRRFSGLRHNRYEHESVSHEHSFLSKMSVAEAVRVSMNLPGVYRAHKFEVNGVKYEGSDGGLISNMSLSTFDKKYPTESTIGVFYKTEKELSSAVDVSRMLVLERSEKDLTEEISLLIEASSGIKKEIAVVERVIEKDTDENTSPSISFGLASKKNSLLDEWRKVEGGIAGTQRELDAIENTKSGPIEKWIKMPMTEVGRAFSQYIGSKNQDDLSSSHNLRRLVMINTQDVDTLDFKLDGNDKVNQLKLGNSAMMSMLKGSYCLENHFYYHQFNTVLVEAAGHMLNQAIDNYQVEDSYSIKDSTIPSTSYYGVPALVDDNGVLAQEKLMKGPSSNKLYDTDFKPFTNEDTTRGKGSTPDRGHER
jgi:predicted acylesterase/phospholipase RssA